MELKFTLDEVALVAARNISLHLDYFPWISRIELLSTQNNLVLCDVNYVDKYSRLVSPLYIDYKKRANTSGWFYKSQRITTDAITNVTEDDPVASANAGVAIDTFDAGIEKNTVGINYVWANAGALATRKFIVNLGELLPDT